MNALKPIAKKLEGLQITFDGPIDKQTSVTGQVDSLIREAASPFNLVSENKYVCYNFNWLYFNSLKCMLVGHHGCKQLKKFEKKKYIQYIIHSLILYKVLFIFVVYLSA